MPFLPPSWEWFIEPVKMVMTGGLFIIVLTT